MASIRKITKASVITYSNIGQTKVYVDWIDTAGQKGQTQGVIENAHMQELLKRAKREKVRIERRRFNAEQNPQVPPLKQWKRHADDLEIMIPGRARYLIKPVDQLRGRRLVKIGYRALVSMAGSDDVMYLDKEAQVAPLPPPTHGGPQSFGRYAAVFPLQSEALAAIRKFHDREFGTQENPERSSDLKKIARLLNPF